MPRIAGLHPHPVDRHVGQAIRARRRELGLGQNALGLRLGVSFQQIQKYEQGTNRVSASALHALAGALGVTVASFFLGLDGPDGSEAQRDLIAEMLAAPGGGDMAAAWLAIAPEPRAKLTAVALAFGAA